MFGKHFCKALLLHFLNGNQCKFFQVSGHSLLELAECQEFCIEKVCSGIGQLQVI